MTVTASENGFLVGLDIEILAQAARGDGPDEGEVLVCPSVGHYVSYGDVVAKVWPPPGRSSTDVECLVRRALTVGNIRSLDLDPSYGVQQLTDIGWTTISTSKQSPAPGQRSEDLVLCSLSGMADHVLTAPLDSVLSDLVDVLRDAGRLDTAAAVDRARSTLAESVGQPTRARRPDADREMRMRRPRPTRDGSGSLHAEGRPCHRPTRHAALRASSAG